MRYEIEENTNAVKIFNDDNINVIYQKKYPGGESWADFADAENWARLYIASVEDESAPFAPTYPGDPGTPKPTLEEIEAAKAKIQSLYNIDNK